MSARIALIHATRAAIDPVEDAFSEVWPEARHWSLLDEGLTKALDHAGHLIEEISERFIRLANYAADTDIDGMLFTCTAFGPAIEVCQRKFRFPTLKPNEAMFEAVLDRGDTIGSLASHPVTLTMLQEQLVVLAKERGRNVTIKPLLAEGAWNGLCAGHTDSHDQKVIETAKGLGDCDAILLAQFSMAPLTQAVQSNTQAVVVSSPHAAVRKMRGLIEK